MRWKITVITVVKVNPLKNGSCKNYEGNGTACLLKNKHAEVLCWVRAECLGLADSNPWSVEIGDPISVRLLNAIKIEMRINMLGSWKLKCCKISMTVFTPVCAVVGNCLAKALQPLPNSRHAESCIDFRLTHQHLRFPTCACIHKVCGPVFPRCLSADKDFSSCICKLPLASSFRLCTVVSQRQAVKVLRPLLVGLLYRVHCLHVLTPLSLVWQLDASSPGEGC